MSGCAGIKANGERCRGIAATDSDFCPAHDPARREARREAASKAGRSRPQNTEINVVKGELRTLADQVRKGELDTKVGAVTSQILNVLLRALDLERKIRELDDLEVRLEELEAAQSGGGSFDHRRRLAQLDEERRELEAKVRELERSQKGG